MILPIILTVLPLQPFALAISTQVKGVAPDRQHLYAPTSKQQWTCLDGSKTISALAINDDYCDCPDGSDEPGTSACPNGTFHCLNAGHIGATIRSSRVGDGLCEPECCDGSDEAPGVCPDRCESIGAAYKAEQAATEKARKTGAKIRSTYISFAQKEKVRLEESIAQLKKDIEEKRVLVAEAKDTLNRLESLDAAAVEIKKQSPLYQSLEKHRAAIKALDRRAQRLQETIDKMESLLDDLESGHNPAYVDVAVLNTVKGWRQLKGEPETAESETPAVEGEKKSEDPESEEEESEEDKEDAKWTEWEIKQLAEKVDYVHLLIEHEKHIGGVVGHPGDDEIKSLLFSVEDYLPDSLISAYESLRSTVIDVLSLMGIVPKPASASVDTSKAKQTHDQANAALATKENELRKDETALSKLFDPQWYGVTGEWRKLDGTCLSKDTGEYTYSVCMFSGATQKANQNGATHNLGSFTSWNKSPSVRTGDYEYYTVQHYENGAQCWNGPKRSVTLHLSCGTENELLTVSEPEKCEYHITGKTPVLCLPSTDDGASNGGLKVGNDKGDL